MIHMRPGGKLLLDFFLFTGAFTRIGRGKKSGASDRFSEKKRGMESIHLLHLAYT
jgi:hypothetical protein